MVVGNQKITLIVATPAAAAEQQSDRLGGQTHALGSVADRIMDKAVPIDLDKLRSEINKCLAQMKEVFADLKRPSIDGWKVEQVNVGLAISAEGSVGFATAGVEASVEIRFAPEK